MAYCVWSDVVDIMERAADIVSAAGEQTNVVNEATELADTYLAPLMQVPVAKETDGAYPRFVIRLTALLAADIVAVRRYHGDDDVYDRDYGSGRDALTFTGTKWGHMAMSLLQARRQAKAALDADVTAPESRSPNLVTSFSSTNGTVEVRYAAGFFEDDTRGIFTFTITSDGGTVDGGDLTISCERDREEAVWTDEEVSSSRWYHVAHGLLIRCVDAASEAAWAQDETFTVTCEAGDSQVVAEGVNSQEWNLG